MISEIYTNNKYKNNNPTWHVEDSPWKAKHILSIINKNKLKLNNICEVGCGFGKILEILQKSLNNKSCQLTGYEISEAAYKECLKLKNKNLDFKLEDFLKEEKYFDLAMYIDVIEHIEDYLGFLKKIKNKSKYKIFHFPLDMSVLNVLRSYPLIRDRRAVGHIHYYNKDLIFEILKDLNYEIIDYKYTSTAIDLKAKSFKSLLMKIPRKILFKINKDLTARILGGYSLIILAK